MTAPVAQARRLLGLEDDGAEADLAQLRELIAALRARLSAEELAEINSVLASQGELLASLGYELLQARP